jgi:hypothetical protein
MNRVLGLRQTADGKFIGIVQPGVVLQDLRRMVMLSRYGAARCARKAVSLY